MNYWLSSKDMEFLEVSDGEWHKVEIEYDGLLNLSIVKVDGVYVAAEYPVVSSIVGKEG